MTCNPVAEHNKFGYIHDQNSSTWLKFPRIWANNIWPRWECWPHFCCVSFGGECIIPRRKNHSINAMTFKWKPSKEVCSLQASSDSFLQFTDTDVIISNDLYSNCHNKIMSLDKSHYMISSEWISHSDTSMRNTPDNCLLEKYDRLCSVHYFNFMIYWHRSLPAIRLGRWDLMALG